VVRVEIERLWIVDGVDVKMGELLEWRFKVQNSKPPLASLLGLRPRSNFYIHIRITLAMNR
jgi:hypothetical protein